jgi:MFS family permease
MATPLPIRKLSIVSLILFANNASIWMIFSFLPFMVIYYYPETDPTEVGYLAGILGSAFSLGSLCGNFIWGLLADHIGRRKVLLFGLLGTAFSAALFGISPNFWTAVFARFLWGLLNGNIGVGKTYMAEIHDDSNSARGMAIFGVIGGLGRTVGPSIGGFLAQPADRYPSLKGTIFETYPFALPSVIIVVFCLFVFGVAYFELTETLSSYAPLLNSEDEEDSGGEKSSLPRKDSSLRIENRDVSLLEDESKDLELGPSSMMQSLRKYLSPSEYMHLASNDEIELSSSSVSTNSLVENSPDQETNSQRSRTKGKRRLTFNGIVEKQSLESGLCEYSSLKDREPKKLTKSDLDDLENGFNSHDYSHPTVRLTNGSELITAEVEKEYYSSPWNQIRYFFRTRMIITSLLLYGLLSLVHVIAVEILPLWLVISREKGGFGFSSSQIGLVITLTGPVNIFSQLFVYPFLVEKYGPLQVFRTGIKIYIVCSLLLPFCTLGMLRDMGLLSTILVIVGNSILTSVAGWCFICIFVFINNSCYSHQRGKVNGLGQSFASLGRLVGPICGSSMFAWTTTHNSHWPFNYAFTWYIIALSATFIWKLASRLPKKIAKRRREPRVPRYALSMIKHGEEIVE